MGIETFNCIALSAPTLDVWPTCLDIVGNLGGVWGGLKEERGDSPVTLDVEKFCCSIMDSWKLQSSALTARDALVNIEVRGGPSHSRWAGRGGGLETRRGLGVVGAYRPLFS